MQREFLFLTVEVTKSLVNVEMCWMVMAEESEYGRAKKGYSFLSGQKVF
jgi:hypothetical protein